MSQRTVRAGPKRPIDKALININIDAQGTTQASVQLRNASLAETLVRLVGNISLAGGAGNQAIASLLIIMQRDGAGISSIVQTNAGSMYQPEQDVLWHKMLVGIFNDEIVQLDIDVKGMRKLKPGDKIMFILDCNIADGFDITGSLTQFYKQ